MHEAQKRIDWFDTIVTSIKKRLGEVTKLAKETQAKLALADTGSPSMDPEEEARRQEFLDSLEEQMKTMKKDFAKVKLNVDISSSQVSNKVDQHIVKELEERFEKSLKGIRRDLTIKDKKIERLAKAGTSQGGGNQSGEENN